MRIGIDIRNIGKKRTGDEMVFFNLVKNLAEIDNENNYKLFTDINNKETVADIKKRLGIENKDNFEIISLKSSSKFIWNFWTLPNYLRKNPVDIYHTQYITPFFVSKKINHHTKNPHKRLWNNLLVMLHLRKSGVGVKIITIVHDISFNFYPRFIKFLDLFFLKILIPMSLRRADKVIGVSKFTRDEIVKYYKIYPHTKTPGLSGFFKNYFAKIKEKYFGVGVNPGKVDFIYNAVGDDFLNNNFSSEQLSSVGKKYNLPENFIFHMGTMQPRKNIPILIKAYSKIKDRLGGTKLVL
ncbi:MAG TPA: hypothetical protein ENG89_01155, partial [Candidatus Moranbacteria bacterium]|nr:hypothetical protein [Candidatus Moranbacteria bacterium]